MPCNLNAPVLTVSTYISVYGIRRVARGNGGYSKLGYWGGGGERFSEIFLFRTRRGTANAEQHRSTNIDSSLFSRGEGTAEEDIDEPRQRKYF